MCVEINHIAYYTCNLGPLQEQLAFLTAELSFQTCRSVNYTIFLKFLLFLYAPIFCFKETESEICLGYLSVYLMLVQKHC